jgi:hypothetical protein
MYCRLSHVPLWQTLLILPSDVVPMLHILQRKSA